MNFEIRGLIASWGQLYLQEAILPTGGEPLLQDHHLSKAALI